MRMMAMPGLDTKQHNSVRGQVLKKEEGWLDGFRVSFRVDNVFDARRRGEDENGVVPDAFQPFRVDPTGRYIGVDLRKAF